MKTENIPSAPGRFFLPLVGNPSPKGGLYSDLHHHRSVLSDSELFHSCAHFSSPKKKTAFVTCFGVIFPSKDKRFTLNQPPSSMAPVMNDIYKIYVMALPNKPLPVRVQRVVTVGAGSGLVTGSKCQEASRYTGDVLFLDHGVSGENSTTYTL